MPILQAWIIRIQCTLGWILQPLTVGRVFGAEQRAGHGPFCCPGSIGLLKCLLRGKSSILSFSLKSHHRRFAQLCDWHSSIGYSEAVHRRRRCGSDIGQAGFGSGRYSFACESVPSLVTFRIYYSLYEGNVPGLLTRFDLQVAIVCPVFVFQAFG